MTSISVTNESVIPCDAEAIATMLEHHMPRTGIDPASAVDVLLVDEPRMTELHVQWMHEPGPTDVLSFPMDEVRGADPGDPLTFGMLGDIVVCPSVAQHQALVKGIDLHEEIAFLITHGYLHLIGFDHADEVDQTAMFGLQDRLLDEWRGTQERT
jgi:probable rRNA maturation factor